MEKEFEKLKRYAKVYLKPYHHRRLQLQDEIDSLNENINEVLNSELPMEDSTRLLATYREDLNEKVSQLAGIQIHDFWEDVSVKMPEYWSDPAVLIRASRKPVY